MASYDYDLIVIGSGAGGNIAAQQVAKAGKSVAIVEAGSFGGTEVSGGRVPISALLQSAKVFESAKHGSSFGVRGATIGYNYPSIKAWKDLVVKRTGIHSGEFSFAQLGINVIQGKAYFIDANTISIGAARFTAKEFLIATGSETILPEINGLAKSGFLTVRDALNVTRPPKKLAILGGSPYSYELAQLFAVFGTKVYFIETSSRLAHHEEPEVSSLLKTTFEDLYSMSVITNAVIETVEPTAIGKKITVLHGSKKSTISVDDILVATEKTATTDIGLENAGVQYKDGAILTNPNMQTSAKHIYAAGSCTGPDGNGHVATYQSQIVARNIMHPKNPMTMDYRAIPRCLFTSPEIAAVGVTEADLKESKTEYNVVTVPLSVITKANTADFSEGFIKIMAAKKTNTLLGATIVSPCASEAIHELALAIRYYLNAEQIAKTVHVFPSWSEIIRVACTKLAKLDR